MSPATNEFGKYSEIPNYGICHTYLIRVYAVSYTHLMSKTNIHCLAKNQIKTIFFFVLI